MILTTVPHRGCVPNAGTFAGIELSGQKSSSTHARMTARHVRKKPRLQKAKKAPLGSATAS